MTGPSVDVDPNEAVPAATVAAWVAASRLDPATVPTTTIGLTGSDPVHVARHPIASTAAVAIGLTGAAAADLHLERTGTAQSVSVDIADAGAAITSLDLQRLDGRPARLPAPPTTGLFESSSGRWIHLQGNLPHLHAGTLDALHLGPDAAVDDVRRAVADQDALELEDELADRGLCGAAVRTPDEWLAHPQGRFTSSVPAVEVLRIGDAEREPLPASDRPLAGVRVLDLTRILAGPVCGRTLAEHGADVLMVSAPHLPNIPLTIMDSGHGKRNAFLDVRDDEDRARLLELVRGADVFTNGYRPDGLDRHGLGPQDLAELRPGIVYVSIDCYGHDGPWRSRGGWEQMAQAASGIAAIEGSFDAPRIFPAPFDDYVTGYLGALGAMVALRRRSREGGSWWVRASLCQTAAWIRRRGAPCRPEEASGLPARIDDRMVEAETSFGRLRHLPPVVQMSATPPRWDRVSAPLGSHAAGWLARSA